MENRNTSSGFEFSWVKLTLWEFSNLPCIYYPSNSIWRDWVCTLSKSYWCKKQYEQPKTWVWQYFLVCRRGKV